MAVTLNASTSAGLVQTADTSGNIALQNNGTTAVTVTGGNVGIGTSTPLYTTTNRTVLSVNGTSSSLIGLSTGSSTSTSAYLFFSNPDLSITNATTAGTMNFLTNNTERMRITSGGDLLVGTTDSAITSGVGVKFVASSTSPYMGYVINASGGGSHYHLYNTNATNNGYRFYVNINGGISNYSGNDVNLSDERVKTNIELAGLYLNKICSIPIKLFNYKDEPTGEQKTLGVIAQDVEAVAPEFINNEGFGETKEGEEPLKSVYTTDLMFALMKCIQEQQAQIEELKAEVAALKGVA